MFFGCIPIATSVSCVPWMLGGGSRGILISENNFSGSRVERGKRREDSQDVLNRVERGKKEEDRENQEPRAKSQDGEKGSGQWSVVSGQMIRKSFINY